MIHRWWLSAIRAVLCALIVAQAPLALAQDRDARSLQKLGQRWRKVDDLLRQELTRHWYPHAVDRSRGGFINRWRATGRSSPTTNAFLVYQARMTWTAAAFARYSPAHRDEFVLYARHGIAFLDRVMRDNEQGGSTGSSTRRAG